VRHGKGSCYGGISYSGVELALEGVELKRVIERAATVPKIGTIRG